MYVQLYIRCLFVLDENYTRVILSIDVIIFQYTSIIREFDIFNDITIHYY